VGEDGAADGLGLDVGVGDLVRHAEGERQVGEVEVVRLGALEVDAARRRVVVQVGVAQDVGGVHHAPRQDDGEHGEGAQQDLGRAALVGGLGQCETDAHQADQAGAHQHEARHGPGLVLPDGEARCLGAVEAVDLAPDDQQEGGGDAIPEHEHVELPRGEGRDGEEQRDADDHRGQQSFEGRCLVAGPAQHRRQV
jgi:hypothetical protein